MTTVNVVGAGLAGSEAALVLSASGLDVKLYEMRPQVKTAAHRSEYFAELVCSNSFGSMGLRDGKGLLKAELEVFGSNLIAIARSVRVKAGKALAVDRWRFQAEVTRLLGSRKNVEIIREEVTPSELEGVSVIATGPLTSKRMAGAFSQLLGEDNLYFYDAISPIIETDSLDISKCFYANRYGEGDDYLNFPMTESEYREFYGNLLEAETVSPHSFENERFFESCMPIEALAKRGEKTLLFGPMKPVGLIDPSTGKMPYCVVQLRKENEEGTMVNMVGFQTRMKQGEQKRVIGLIPGFESARYFRFGSIHRNTFLNSPSFLEPTLAMRQDENTFFAGQITGVEGYVESIASGLIAGINASRVSRGVEPLTFPPTTMTGGLIHYISRSERQPFQPMNANFGLLPLPPGKYKKGGKRQLQAERAIDDAGKFKDLFFKFDPLCVI